MEFCKRCLYTTAHPLGLTIDQDGICSGCRVHQEKDQLDWQERWSRLEKLVEPYRNPNGSNYDCVVPVTGANDSYYIVHLVKKRLGLNPLLVTYNRYFNTPLGIRNLANLRIRLNCDILYQNVNPESVRRIVRSTLRRFGSMFWPILAGQSVFPVQTAVRYRIPLIIWGAHQGLEQVGMFSHLHEVEMTRRYRKDHDLMGYEADDLPSVFDTLKQRDISQFRYPNDQALSSVGVRGIYIGNFVRWDPKAQHEDMISLYNYASARFERTFDTYDHVECFSYMDLHDQLKLFKHGYSKVTDHATREIRHGRLTRAQGLDLVRHHEQKAPEHVDLFCEWLGLQPTALRFILDQHRNPDYWHEESSGHWVFNGWSARQHIPHDNGAPRTPSSSAAFIATHTRGLDAGDKFITIGKGWPC
ncbi:N-acetyl sugar amidotransferase [Denitromonas ohlonensis]|uniref:N-acetyl sugar amidotransferase n=2 Tax=Denitromonas TaxID=139331 RepID=A0A557R537_9RHOO|nr:N-acetyl sugar amidotransferase [Denitromonas ohlonensis]TVO60268.1 N-acetyl sugar amidotransferase [Denitromonas ohlonensis]TVO75753.1 N-acetyl sugar amidotransferase [Denitromonas ohlonensis]